MLDRTEGFSITEETPELVPPDLNVLRLHRRPPPPFPVHLLTPRGSKSTSRNWSKWVEDAAAASCCPVDYVAAPLLSSASVLIGNARWAQAWEGWAEPPHLWVCAVGDSGGGKSPGADPLMRHVLPVIEQNMAVDYPEQLRVYQARAEEAKARNQAWEQDVRAAMKHGGALPMPPDTTDVIEPQKPRLQLGDATIEKVATMLATACPKGVLMMRDELAGWLLGMNNYNDAARGFWLESYGGRSYTVDRQKLAVPIIVNRLAVGWCGGTQPDRLAQLMRDADDGLLARFLWFWPDQLPFKRPERVPNMPWAVDALDRLRALDMLSVDGNGLRPHMVPMRERATVLMKEFGNAMVAKQQNAGGLMRSAYGKARGLCLRLSIVLEFMWWSARDGTAPPPTEISEEAFVSAAALVDEYFMPMAERVYGDAACPKADRDAATLARWIRSTRPYEVHVREMQRKVRLNGLSDAGAIHAAAAVLVDAGWLLEPEVKGDYQRRAKASYPVSPALWPLLRS